MQFYQEWLPLELTSVEGALFLAGSGFAFLGAWDVVRQTEGGFKASLAHWLPDALLSGFFAFCALRGVRMVPYFALASAVLSARGAHALPSTRVFRALFPSGILLRVTSWMNEREGRVAMPGRQLLAGFVFLFALNGYFIGAHPLEPSRALYPYDAVAFLETLPPGNILAAPDLGGFLTLKLWPRNRPLMDDRGTLLGEALYNQYFAAHETPKGFVEFGRSLEAKYILLPPSSKLSSMMAGAGCEKLYSDEQAVLCRVN